MGTPTAAQARLTIVPLTLRDANAFVERTHRHHGAARGCKFSLGVVDDAGTVRGVAIVGRPTSRARDDGLTAEVTRLATDGCPNACSALYAAAWRAAKAMGYLRMGTYILATEPGTSLRGRWLAPRRRGSAAARGPALLGPVLTGTRCRMTTAGATIHPEPTSGASLQQLYIMGLIGRSAVQVTA